MARTSVKSREKARSVDDSKVTMTEIVLPQHTNALGTVFGGTVMSWIDVAASVAAQRHAGSICVTASIDELHFLKGVTQGEIVTIEANLTCVNNTSCEVMVVVSAENPIKRTKFYTTKALLTFVSLDSKGVPTPMPPLITEGAKQKTLEKQAKIRRDHRKKLKVLW